LRSAGSGPAPAPPDLRAEHLARTTFAVLRFNIQCTMKDCLTRMLTLDPITVKSVRSLNLSFAGGGIIHNGMRGMRTGFGGKAVRSSRYRLSRKVFVFYDFKLLLLRSRLPVISCLPLPVMSHQRSPVS
jgi:hypothetical protein